MRFELHRRFRVQSQGMGPGSNKSTQSSRLSFELSEDEEFSVADALAKQEFEQAGLLHRGYVRERGPVCPRTRTDVFQNDDQSIPEQGYARARARQQKHQCRSVVFSTAVSVFLERGFCVY